MSAEHRKNDSSDALFELARALRAETDSTPEREERLRRLAAEVRTGKYKVDARKLARKILQEEKSLATPPPSSDEPE